MHIVLKEKIKLFQNNHHLFYIFAGAVLAAVFAAAYVLSGWEAAALWCFFLAFLLFAWDTRIPGVLALLFLASCPVLLIFHLDTRAEQSAVYAYYFLVMTVVLQIVEYKRKPE